MAVRHAGGQHSYAELDALSDRLAQGLEDVVLRPGQVTTANKLIAFCNERMAAYKYPRLIEFRDGLPTNALGKVLKDEPA